MFNVSCSGSGWDYRATVALACAVPFVVLLLFSFLFLVKRCRAFSKLKKGLSKTALVDIAENIFSYMDKNQDGSIEDFELHQILKVIHSIPDDETFETLDPLILDLRLKLIGEGIDEGLSEKLFVNAFSQNNFGNSDIGKKMIEWAVLQKVRSSMLSGGLLVLFLLHAPISQGIFHYFVCHDIAGRTFLKADYNISCDSDMYKNFRILPIVMLVMFTAGFPVVIFLLLFINRNRLHTPSVKAQFGFLELASTNAPVSSGDDMYLLAGQQPSLPSGATPLQYAPVNALSQVVIDNHLPPHNVPLNLLSRKTSTKY